MTKHNAGYVTAAVRSKRMGHADERTFQAYVSTCSTVDGQSLMLGREAEQEELDLLQSMITRIDTNAPQPLGARLTDVKRIGPKRWNEFRKAKQQYFESDSAYSLTYARPLGLDDEYREDFVEETNSTVLHSRPPPTQYLQAYLLWDKPRATLIQHYYHREAGRRYQLEDFVEPLLSIASSERTRWCYENFTANEAGECRRCGLQVKSRSVEAANNHLLQCYLKHRQSRAADELLDQVRRRHTFCQWSRCERFLSPLSLDCVAQHNTIHLWDGTSRCHWKGCERTFPSHSALKLHWLRDHYLPLPDTLPYTSYCHQCMAYFDTKLDWRNHCEEHLNNLADNFCGQISRRGVLIWAYHCPCCLGDETLLPEERWRQFLSTDKLRCHLRAHLAKIEWPSACPHPLCNVQVVAANDFWAHLDENHVIPPPKHAAETNDLDDSTEGSTKNTTSTSTTGETAERQHSLQVDPSLVDGTSHSLTSPSRIVPTGPSSDKAACLKRRRLAPIHGGQGQSRKRRRC